MSTANEEKSGVDGEARYRYLVVDSGPIIKHTGISNLFGKAESYVTVPGVMDEIRDGKARAHLEQWPMDLQVKTPTRESIQRIIAFSKQTGDYVSLSKVDLEVLALVLDMEMDGCGSLEHVRTTPKRMIGLGNIQSLKKETEEEKKTGANNSGNPVPNNPSTDPSTSTEQTSSEEPQQNDGKESDLQAPESVTPDTPAEPQPAPQVVSSGQKSWAMLVNPSSASKALPQVDASSSASATLFNKPDSGQFSDAEESEDEAPEEENIQSELESEFPSLAAASTVPYEGSDDENESHEPANSVARPSEEDLVQKKMEALKPISKSGKMYNSFRKYGKLMKPKPTAPKPAPKEETIDETAQQDQPEEENDGETKNQQSKIIGAGMMMSSDDMGWEEDDGEGWITCKSDIATMTGMQKKNGENASDNLVGPPKSERTACTTTDFAMQNVLLQMGLSLLSVDGVQIRRLKSWVHRCGACFKIHTEAEFQGMKRLFCSHCGSDMMQRIAASVDGKTGRLKLHLSKKYKHNLRGTKFSLPKPGSGNRFQGDLLLREDQLLTGAWNQKVKIRTGGQSRASAQSIFGKDLASNVGCDTKMLSTDDVRVGFGRRNPNASKGRERRGKKKKSSDRACGLRRY